MGRHGLDDGSAKHPCEWDFLRQPLEGLAEKENGREGLCPARQAKKSVAWQGCRNAVSAFRDTRAGMGFGKGTVSYYVKIYF